MSTNDRFGLQGDPAVWETRRVKFGTDSLDPLFLVLASLTAVMLLIPGVIGGFNWPGILLLLSLPLACWGWFKWFRAHRTSQPHRQLGIKVYLMMVGLRYASELLADAQAGDGLDFWNLGSFLLILLLR
ncbi:hypothetical protein D3875_07030 [Deinococcus cavernae]|uniref:Uncharacterized protein n=1 Tax=Deinococcus cavernae TaxID=2320857 RepID=A0A418V5J1_9DEIO|nr:hypothetical protein [Deinococcus cavernae]RJF71362.1 hypothetical protein D3875_07030 [Deinococcus cavernae]